MFLYAVAFIALSAVFQSFYALVHIVRGEKIEVYPRFLEKEAGGNTKFNFLGLLSPVATENQRVVSDTLKFTEKVVYPVAPRFEIVAPKDSSAEYYVANKIADAIKDSIDKIRIRLGFDYDGQALQVRNAAEPSTVKIQQPKVELSMFGTASPEAIKFGMKKSLMPGNFEKENADLAKSRLERTGALLQRNLSQLKIDSVKVLSEKSLELQLKDSNEVNNVLKNPSILDDMRYVEANVRIPYQRIEITPVTSPIILPLWLLALTWMALALNSLRRKRLGLNVGNFSWKWLRTVLTVLGIISAIVLGFVLIGLIPERIIIWLMIAIALAIVITYIIIITRLILQTTKEDWMNLWRGILQFLRVLLEFFKMLFWGILFIIVAIIIAVGVLWDNLKSWWSKRCDCCKILMILLGLHIIYDIIHWIWPGTFPF